MATITTDTFLDGGTARTAGETWTMNGGVLTVRTDTRAHANAPAAMTGSLGSLTVSSTLGGGVLFDGRNVRWMAYDTGSGNVPAIGTLVTQGGVTGYLLGVWASLNAAPTAPGAAMPATGFLKFREVTGGAFAPGALTGIGASATEADRVGWIEVVMDQAAAVTVPRLGFFRTRGDWFELGLTTGTPGQIVQTPTNGGGAGTHVPAVWIETGPGTGVFECYPALISALFIPANLALDARGKFVETIGTGQVRIGNNGTANVGFTPPAGCRIRIPNVIGHQCTTAARATNQVPNATLATRPDFATTAAGEIDMEFFLNDWYHLFQNAFRVRILHSATFDNHTSSNEASPMELDDYVVGVYNNSSVALVLTSCFLGGRMDNCKFFRGDAATNGHAATMTAVFDLESNNCHFGVVTYARSSGRALAASQCIRLTFNDFYQYNALASFSTCFQIRVNGIDHTDRLFGNTNTTTGLNVTLFAVSCDDCIVDGITFGQKGTLSGFFNPAGALLSCTNSTNIIMRNGGTPAAPLQAASAALAPASIYSDGGGNDGISVQRVYLNQTLTNIFTTNATSKNQSFENLTGTTGSLQILSLNSYARGIRSASNSVTGGSSVYGSHAFDMFTSDTSGRVWFAMNEPTSFNAGEVTLTLAGATGGFTSAGNVVMPTVGDQIVMDMPYYVLGHTALANIAPTITGTNKGNFSYEYDIDTGDGFSGLFKTLTGANLSAEVISPSTGFRLRLRITTTVANTTNALTFIRIDTVTTLSAQRDNPYPLETASPSFTLTGLATGSEVVLFDSANVEIDRQVVASPIYTYAYQWDSNAGDRVGVYALIWKNDRYPIKITGLTLGNRDQTQAVVQSLDRVYLDASAVSTFDAALKLQIMNPAITKVSVSRLYSDWKNWLLQDSNAQYDFMYSQLGGDVVSAGVSIPFYVFLLNGWRIRPQEANHTLTVDTGTLVATGDPFVNTLGAFVVRINYQQPVQALAVSTSGGGGASAADVRAELEAELALIRNNVPLIPAAL